MKQPDPTIRYYKWIPVLLLLPLLQPGTLQAQQQKIAEYVLFGGNSTCAGCSVQISSSTTIKGGSVGSYSLIKSSGTATINANLYSGGTIQLANSNAVTGKITAANSGSITGTTLSIGSSAAINGNIDVNGNIVIGGGTVSGSVTHPAGTTYKGPTPTGGAITGTPALPVLPLMPGITNVPDTGSKNITASQTITPGGYGAVTLGGNKTLTLSGTGVYIFKSIKNSGNANSFIFDFKNATSGTFQLYIIGDADMDKVSVSLKNGGSAARIYTEVHGTGTTSTSGTVAWNIANGASGSVSKWLGTVWAPNAAINVGSGTGSSSLTGSFWSGTGITVQSGVTITYESFTGNNSPIAPYYPPPVNGKVNDLLGSELNSLYYNASTLTDVSQNIFIISNNTVMIEVIARSGKAAQLLSLLQTAEYGLTNIISNGPNSLVITGRYPIANLLKLDALTDLIDYCRPLYPAIGSAGITTSHGDVAIGAGFVRNGYTVSGNGVKVAVLSDSYNSIPNNPAATDVLNGDLPGPGNPENTTTVEVVKEYPFGRQSDEGRAMLQIVHDLAPKAQLGFRTGFISPGDLALGIKELKAKAYNVMVDDITYITEPFLQDGVVAQAIDEVTAQGVSYFAAAGNYGKQSYQGTFNAYQAPAGITGTAHNFGGGDIFQNVSLKPGTYTIVLQWQDAFYSLGQSTTGTQNDLDIYLTDDRGVTLFGFNRNNLGGDPIEVLPFIVSANAQTNLMVVRAAGSSAVTFKYIVFRGDLTINEYNTGQSTIVGGGNAAGAMTVGAVRYTNTPAFGIGAPVLETFSSMGGTPVNGAVRSKPDFTAPDGVNTTVNFNSLNIEGDAFPNFFGTSAAAPHAAGVAALLLEAKQKFSSQTLSPAQMRSLLQSTALDMGTTGPDLSSGSGFIQAQAALATFANPTPVITSLILPNTTIVPGTSAFTVTVQGNYFTNDTKVLFRGTELPTTVLSATQVTAPVPTFTGNPAVQAYTKPKAVNGNDGGTTPPVYFFSVVKKKIVVTAADTSKRFGEKMPSFTATVTVDGVPLANSGLTLAKLGLDNLQFTTPATDLSNAGKYFIRPVRKFDTTNAADAALLESYEYTFKDGVLDIQKMPLVITPENKTITYGDKVKNITFTYQYNDQNIALGNRTAFLNNLKTEHASNLVDTAIGFVNGKAIVGGKTLTSADLQNMSFLASGKAIVGGKAVVAGKAIVGGVLVPDTMRVVEIDAASIFNYEKDPNQAVLINGKAIVGGKAIVAGKAIVGGKAIVAGTQYVNSTSINDSSNSNVVVIVDAADVEAPDNTSLGNLKAINLVTGFDAGASFIVPGALLSENFAVSYGLGKLTVLPAALTVTAKDTFIFQNDPLPTFASTITGFVNGENTVVSGPQYTVTPAYSGGAGVYTIKPGAVTLSSPGNYAINYITGALYVNPAGGGARNIQPKLDCVELLATPVSGFRYVAHFSYTNPNTTPVYVPFGSNNLLTATGSYLGVPPQVFLTTGGTFNVYFDGQKLTWMVTTYNGSKKTAVSSDASSTSGRCSSAILTSNSTTTGSNPALQSEADTAPENLTAHPNPANNMVTITGHSLSAKDLVIIDMLGKTHRPKLVQTLSATRVLLDVSNLNSGVYMVKIKTGMAYKTVRIVKL